MELGLSLGGGRGRDPSTTRALMFVGNGHNNNNHSRGLGFCMSFDDGDGRGNENRGVSASADPVQLDLLPLGPVQRSQASSHLGLPWQNENRGFDVNRVPSNEVVEDGVGACSPNSTLSSFQMDFSIHRSGGGRDSEPLGVEMDPERASSRASDDDDNGTRKKLRLSKDQSAFLEDSFKEHNTLNPKQKLELAKQLNLRPRQVEVWFQNRRARTKLKQTEVDCEYLKRCCETLTEENRRLQKELQELRALKACNPFYMQLPATTLTMCPSCERVVTTTSTNKASAPGGGGSLAIPSGVSPFSHQAFAPKSTAT